jgi:mannose-6-phosphate isomerase-like protein (cupin superfamily)
MNRYIYKPDPSRAFEVGGVRGFAVTAGAGRISGDVALLSVSGSHGQVKDLSSDRFYVVSEGSGTFVIDGKTYAVTVDDVVIIPPNVPFDFSGEMKLIMFCSPPFDPANDVLLTKRTCS